MGWRQRLGVQDALWLEMDKPGNLMVVDNLFWTAEPIDWDRYRKLTRERLWDRYPVFRSVVARGDDGAWYWEEQPGADLDSHFELVELPRPGEDAELQDLVASQRAVPLDRTRPLWHALLVDGYRGGSAVLLRGHHAIADGIRLVQLSMSIFDATPDGGQVPPPPSRRPAAAKAPDRPGEDGRGSVAAQLRSLAGGAVGTSVQLAGGAVGTSVQLARGVVTNPVGAAHTAVTLSGPALGAAEARARSLVGRRRLGPLGPPGFLAAVPGDVDTARKLLLGTRNDSTSWTGTVTTSKAVAWTPPLPLDDVKAVARAHDATVNDVLVACVAESLRAYLVKHHAVCRSVTWDVPVNLRPLDPSLPVVLGNSFALVQLELPTDIDDPVRVLEVVRHRMRRIKSGHEAVVDYGIQAAISRMSRRLARSATDLLANRAVGVLTDVPGPQVPLYAAGRKVEGMMGWAPLTADQVISFTIFSYAGKVFVGIACDRVLVPDHEQIVDGFADGFRRLSLLTR